MNINVPTPNFQNYLSNILKAKATKNAIVGYFPEADLRCGHSGLSQQATKAKIDLKNLARGEYVVFLNKRQDKMKIMTAGNMLVYQKTFNYSKINPHIISLIPKYFGGRGLDYEGALREAIEKDFKRA